MTSPLIDRFRESMVMNHERWHDGIGYDLQLLAEATPEELAQIESLLTSRGIHDWRDVQALAAINTPRAREILQQTFHTGDVQMRAMIVTHAPGVVSQDQRTDALVAALEQEDAGSLTQVMLEVESHHPPRVV